MPKLDDTDPWREAFLLYYTEWGNKMKAAKQAGVSVATVRARAAQDPSFARDIELAKEAFLDGLEEDLVRLGRNHRNVIGTLARLKADRPHRYVERLQVEGTLRHLQADLSEQAAQILLAIAQDRPGLALTVESPLALAEETSPAP